MDTPVGVPPQVVVGIPEGLFLAETPRGMYSEFSVGIPPKNLPTITPWMYAGIFLWIFLRISSGILLEIPSGISPEIISWIHPRLSLVILLEIIQ